MELGFNWGNHRIMGYRIMAFRLSMILCHMIL